MLKEHQFKKDRKELEDIASSEDSQLNTSIKSNEVSINSENKEEKKEPVKKETVQDEEEKKERA